MMSFKKNNRGALTDIFLFLILAFVFAVVLGMVYFMCISVYAKMSAQAPQLQETMAGTGENVTILMGQTVGKSIIANESLKWITGLLILGMFISILIGSFLVRVHPVFFVAYIFISLAAIIISVPLSNAYESIYSNPVLSASFTGFWGQNYIMLNLPIWITVVSILAGIFLFINMVRGDQYA